MVVNLVKLELNPLKLHLKQLFNVTFALNSGEMLILLTILRTIIKLISTIVVGNAIVLKTIKATDAIVVALVTIIFVKILTIVNSSCSITNNTSNKGKKQYQNNGIK